MSEIISYDNCGLSNEDIERITVTLAVSSHAERNFLDIAIQKIKKLNEWYKLSDNKDREFAEDQR